MEKILLINQNKDEVEDLKSKFTGMDYKVYSTDKSTRAMAMVDNDNISLVIMSYTQEDQNRVKFLEHAKKRYKGMKIILISEIMNEQILSEVKGLIDSALIKPFDDQKLYELVEKMIPKKKKESSLNTLDKKVFQTG
ncbi:MAG: response regulator [Deltaproteobacteria bacterium]|nr:MAG: response regulator [Deltaproteobacteria bacterium]